MALKELSDQDIIDAMYTIQELQDMHDSDPFEYLAPETEVQCLEQHTGMSVQKLLDNYHV